MRNLCLIRIYILRNNAFQISNEASCLKFFLSYSSRLGKTSSAYSFILYTVGNITNKRSVTVFSLELGLDNPILHSTQDWSHPHSFLFVPA